MTIPIIPVSARVDLLEQRVRDLERLIEALLRRDPKAM